MHHRGVLEALVAVLLAVSDAATVRRDAGFGPCRDGTYFNSENKCVSSCPPHFFGDYDTGRCLPCAAWCKTCTEEATRCTSCKSPNYLLGNRCEVSCGDKKTQGPMNQRARLVGGSTSFEGRLEILHEGVWGTVCDDDWGLQDTEVVCRELQLGSAVEHTGADQFDTSERPALIHLDNVQCTGKEDYLGMCAHNGWGNHDCGHSEDVGIYCSGPDVSRLCVDKCSDGYFENHGNCQLCDAKCKMCSGSAQNCQKCEEPYFLQGNECLQNCNFGFFGHTESRECRLCSEECQNCQNGLEGDVCTSCPEGKFLLDGRCVLSCGNNLNEKHLPVRLVGGKTPYEGRVEVYVNEKWGTICDDRWDILDVEVLCRQLGFGHALHALHFSSYSAGEGPIHMDRIDCTGKEEELIHCTQATFEENTCSHSEDAGAVCAGTGSIVTYWGSYLSTVSNVGVSGQCVEDCGVGYYLDNRQCKTCAAECLTCEGGESNQCSQCKPGRFLKNKSCVGSCGDGYYGNTETNTCQLCDSNCARCADGVSGDKCLACGSHWLLYDSACTLLCPQNTFESDGACVETCPFGQYGSDGMCKECSALGCRTCDSNGGCTSCVLGKILEGNQCTERCSSGKKEMPMDILSDKSLREPGIITRLVGGRNHLEGRLEVIYNNEWGTVCNDLWRISAGRVACNEMGYGEVEQLLTVGGASGIPLADADQIIWLDNVLCMNSETSITECTHLEWGLNNCNHTQDVALRCSGPGYRKCVTSCPDGYYEDSGECKLCNMNCERCSKGASGYTCQSCKEGFNVLNGKECVMDCAPGHLDGGSGVCHRCDLSCQTCEGTTTTCTSCREGSYLKGSQCVSNCGDQLILDLGSHVRLVNGLSPYSGRVEVSTGDGSWGTVCDDNWGLEEAMIVCRELGLGEAVEAHQEAHFGSGSGNIVLDDLECFGDEESLFYCRHSGIGNHDCTSSEDAGVTCSGPLLSNKCMPREQCRDGFFINNDQCSKCSSRCATCAASPDICLSCKPGQFLLQNKCLDFCPVSFFGSPDGVCYQCSPACKECDGRSDLCTRCHAGMFLNVQTNNCENGCPTGFMTRAKSTVRLVNGGSALEGRVEVQHNGVWGTVCDDDWHLEDGNVVCNMLGLGNATKVVHRGEFGAGTGEIWLDELKCAGNERDIKQCRLGGTSRTIGIHDCGHDEDAGVICAGPDTARQCVGSCGDGYYPDDNRECQECSPLCATCSGEADSCDSCPEGMYLKTSDRACVAFCGSGYHGDTDERVCRECESPCKECFNGRENNQCSSCIEGYYLEGHECKSTCSEGSSPVSDLISNLGLSADRVRLVGGGNPREGIVQVQHNGVWGGICGTHWDKGDAEVVCRELGFGLPVTTASASQFTIPEEQYPTHMDEVQCIRNEYYLTMCKHAGYGKVSCDPNHVDDAAVQCSDVALHVDHHSEQEPRICRKLNDVHCTRNTCYPQVPCLNVGMNNSVCMECPDGMFGDGINCKVAAIALPEFRDTSKGQNRTVMGGDMLTFLCAGKGNPAPGVTASNWRKDNKPLSAESLASGRITVFQYGSLYISQTRMEDSGVYTCTLENSAGIRSENSYLTVNESPKFLNVEPAFGSLGGSATLKCMPRGHPAPLITWMFGDQVITSGGRYSLSDDQHSLEISGLQHSDNGSYTCISSNDLGSYTASIPLTVQEPPTFGQQILPEVEVEKGEMVTINCQVTGKPAPRLYWKKDGETFNNPRYYISGQSLSVMLVEPDDTGEYSCIAVNSVAVTEASTKILVIGPPKIQEGPANKTKTTGETVDFTCKVMGSHDPKVIWKRDDKPIKNDDRYTVDEGHLKIEKLTPGDSGKYTCVAKNSKGNTTADAFMVVDDAVKSGSLRQVGSSMKFLLPILLLMVIVVVAVYLVWKRRNPGKAKYDLFGVKSTNTGTSFTPIYVKGKQPNGSPGGNKVEIKKEQDTMLQSILSKEEDQEHLMDEGPL